MGVTCPAEEREDIDDHDHELVEPELEENNFNFTMVGLVGGVVDAAVSAMSKWELVLSVRQGCASFFATNGHPVYCDRECLTRLSYELDTQG